MTNGTPAVLRGHVPPRAPRPALALCALALAVLPLGCRDAAPASNGDVVLLHGHAEAFLIWAERGIKDQTLVHIDAHDDFRREVPKHQLDRLQQMLDARRLDKIANRLDTGVSELMDEGNFLHAAHRFGQIKEVYWVVAFGSRSSPTLQSADRRALRAMGFTEEEVRAFRSEQGRLVGEVRGVRLVVCGMADLPRFREPVLLDVDIDLFSILMRDYEIPVATSLRAFRRDLRASRLRFELATIAHSIEDGYTKLHHAYIADAVRDILTDPRHELEPAQWQLLRQRSRAESRHAEKDYDEAVAINNEILRAAPGDAAAHYAIARAYVELGRYGAALEHADLAARLDPLYELGLVTLGEAVAARDGDGALQFFDHAEALAPGSERVTRARGDYFFERGLYRLALAQYTKLQLGSGMELAMRIGDAYMELEDYDDGLMYYEIGLRIGAAEGRIDDRKYSDSWLHLGRYYEHVAADHDRARTYYDRYLTALRSAGSSSDGLAAVRSVSKLYD